MTLNPQQFHATLNPSWSWSADGEHHSAEVAISNPTNPDAIGGGRISWASRHGEANFHSNRGDVYDIEGSHKTLGAAVTAFNRQHIPNAKVVKKFKNSEVQPLAQEIQDAGGFDAWQERQRR
jgi:hypothetical protein